MSFQFKSIRQRYIAITMLIIFISVFIVSAFSLPIAANIVADLSKERLQEAVQRNSAELNGWFQQYYDLIDNTARAIEINDNFEREYLERVLKGTYQIYRKEASDVYMGFADGSRPISGFGWVPQAGYDARVRPWYHEASRSDGVIFSDPYVDAMTGRIVITLARRVGNEHGIIGVIAMDIFISDIISKVDRFRISDNGYAFLIDEGGDYVSHPEPGFQPSVEGFRNVVDFREQNYRLLVDELKPKEVRIIETVDYDGRDKLFVLNEIPVNGWVFGIAIPASDYQQPLTYLFWGFMLALIVSLTFGIIIMLKLVGNIVRPIQILKNVVNDFANKDMDSRVKINSNDEIGQLGVSFNQMADTIQQYSADLEGMVKERTGQLQEKNQHIQESIEYALKIQQSILPSEAMCRKLLGEYFVIWRPRDTVGGDFYWLKDFPHGYVVIVGDCTGHGVPGALMTIAAKAVIDRAVTENTCQHPADILAEINEQLGTNLSHEQGGKYLQDGLDAGVVYVDKSNSFSRFAGAGISLHINDSSYRMIKGSHHNIGYHSLAKRVVFTEAEFTTNQGASIYMATDGLRDQIGELDGLPFGNSRLTALLESLKGLTMDEQKIKIIEAYARHQGNEIPRDDLTVLGFCI